MPTTSHSHITPSFFVRCIATCLTAILAACSPPTGHNDSPRSFERRIAAVPIDWPDTVPWPVELERVVSPDESSPLVLTHIGAVALASDGTVIVVDNNPGRVLAFPLRSSVPDRIIAAAGDGPGEVRLPVIAIAGDTILVYSSPHARLARFDLSGDLLGEAMLPSYRHGSPIAVDTLGRTWLIDGLRTREMTALTSQWVRYSVDGNRLDSVAIPSLVEPRYWEGRDGPTAIRWPIPLTPASRHLVLRSGRIIHGRTDRDEFVVSDSGVDTALIFGRPGTAPVAVSDQERRSIMARYAADPRLKGVADIGDVPIVHPLWISLHEDGSGNIWVRRVSPPDHADKSLFDIYSPNFGYRGTASVPTTASMMAWSRNHIAFVITDGDGVVRIEVYRVR